MLRLLRRVLPERREAAVVDEDAPYADIQEPSRNAEEPKPSSQAPLKVLEGHTDGVDGLAFFPDGHRLLSGSWDQSLIIWDVTTGEVENKLTSHTDKVRSVAIAPDGSVFASGSQDGTVRIWKGTTGKQIGEPITMHPQGAGVWGLSFFPDGQRVAATGNGQVQICDVSTTQGLVGDPLRIPGTGGLYSVSLSPDGSRIVADSGGGAVCVWRAVAGREVVFDSLKGHTGHVKWTAFTPDGRQLVTASDDTICRWDMESGAQIGIPLTGHLGYIYDGVLSHDGNTLATASSDRRVRFWNLKTGNQKSRFLQHQFPVYRVALSRDGSLLATGCWNGIIYVWDMKIIEAEFDEEAQDEAEEEPVQEQDQPKATREDDGKSETSSTRKYLDMFAVGFPVSGAGIEASYYDREGGFWEGYNPAGPSDVTGLGKEQADDGVTLDPPERRRRIFKRFFENNSCDARPQAPHPVDEAPKKPFSQFRDKFTGKKKLLDTETQTQPERQQSVPKGEPPLDPETVTTPKALTEKGKGKQREFNTNAVPTGTGRSAIPSPEPRPAAPASHTKHHFRHRVNRIRQPRIRPERQRHAYVAELRDRLIFAWDTRPLPDEIERGPCFHFWSYICFGQRDPNINPDENVAQPTAQLDPSHHDAARTNLRSLGPLDRLSVWLRLRKPPPPTAASPSTNVQSTSSPHTDPNASIPLANQPPPSNAITSRVDIPVLVHPPTISSQTRSPPAQAPARADLNADMDDSRSEAESNPWLPTDAERVDPTSASASTEYMGQLHPDNPWCDD